MHAFPGRPCTPSGPPGAPRSKQKRSEVSRFTSCGVVKIEGRLILTGVVFSNENAAQGYKNRLFWAEFSGKASLAVPRPDVGCYQSFYNNSERTGLALLLSNMNLKSSIAILRAAVPDTEWHEVKAGIKQITFRAKPQIQHRRKKRMHKTSTKYYFNVEIIFFLNHLSSVV